MSENATAQEATDATGSSAEDDAAKKNSRVTVNFTLPQGVDPKEMTLENYKDLTGKRYRMTGDQTERVKAGTLSREQAFEDSKALAIEQLGGKQDER